MTAPLPSLLRRSLDRHSPSPSAYSSVSATQLNHERTASSAGSDREHNIESLIANVDDDDASSFRSRANSLDDVPRSTPSLATPEYHHDHQDVDGENLTENAADPRELLRKQLDNTRLLKTRDRSESTVVDESSKLGLETLTVDTGTSQYSPRRYFILSSAGKLIWTTDRDEEAASGYAGVIQAIISIFADEGDRIRYVNAGSTKICFLLKGPIYLLCVSDWGEPESVLRTQLDYLYLQILSIVTLSQLTGIFAKRSNFDLRRLLEGTEQFIAAMAKQVQTSLPILTNSLNSFRLDPNLRSEIGKILLPSAKINDLLYVILVSSGRLVTLLRPKRHSVHPTDLHILLSTILSNRTFVEGGTHNWLPICLPRFNSGGFLHACVTFFDRPSSSTFPHAVYPEHRTGLILLGGDKNSFEPMKAHSELVQQKMMQAGLVQRLEETEEGRSGYSIAELGLPGLRHFFYKSKTVVQVTFSNWEDEYLIHEDQSRLLTLYQQLYEGIHSKTARGSSASKLIYLRTEQEAVMAWSTSTFEVYLTTTPLLSKTAIVSIARSISRWMKKEEASLFLTGGSTF